MADRQALLAQNLAAPLGAGQRLKRSNEVFGVVAQQHGRLTEGREGGPNNGADLRWRGGFTAVRVDDFQQAMRHFKAQMAVGIERAAHPPQFGDAIIGDVSHVAEQFTGTCLQACRDDFAADGDPLQPKVRGVQPGGPTCAAPPASVTLPSAPRALTLICTMSDSSIKPCINRPNAASAK